MMTVAELLAEWNNSSDCVLVHTSGSTGRPKPMLAEKRRMEASARITCQFLGLKQGDTALLCLPLDYIAGKMMVVRSLTCGLRLVSVEPGGHPLASLTEHIDFAAMSHIALRRLSGPDAAEWYTPFPTVAVSLNDEGCLVIDAPQVCSSILTTNDIAEISNGRFRILGRRDNVVCSGGLKIQIEEVERLLQPCLHAPFCVSKRPDARLGEALVLLTEDVDISRVSACCERVLPAYWRPRHFLTVTAIPHTPTGKIARQEALRLAIEA